MLVVDRVSFTYPSSLTGDPACDPLLHDELNHVAEELGEEIATSTNCSHDDTVTKTQQDDDSTPVDHTVTKQP